MNVLQVTIKGPERLGSAVLLVNCEQQIHLTHLVSLLLTLNILELLGS